MGTGETEYLLATNAGYGFVAPLGELVTRNKAGKATLRVPDGAKVLIPQPVHDFDDDWIAVITSVGRMLIFTAGEMTKLSKGKGIKLINIPTAKFKEGEESVIGFTLFKEGNSLRVYSGKRYINLKPSDFDNYVGMRAQRGRFLPRGFRQVQHIETIAK